jgi:GNAT superfamily N-acetyltransferase
VIRLRSVEASESALVFSFLTIAARMIESDEPIQKALVDQELTKYWQAWGQASDLGIVAVREADGVPVCCAWLRQLPREDPGFVADCVLELAVGTIASERGRGIGRQVLAELIEVCGPQTNGISLSVRADNPALRLYQRLGFETTAEIVNRVGTRSLRMLLRFSAA